MCPSAVSLCREFLASFSLRELFVRSAPRQGLRQVSVPLLDAFAIPIASRKPIAADR
jgi:hypothetical protein